MPDSLSGWIKTSRQNPKAAPADVHRITATAAAANLKDALTANKFTSRLPSILNFLLRRRIR